MKLWIGTSGYSYPEWKGSFYPKDLPNTKLFSHYASVFDTVEINATFYRMPTDKLVDGWVKTAPPGFRFTFKAPKTITHIKKLKDCADALSFFLGRADRLGAHGAALLFQLPPFLRRDVALLSEFLAMFPRGADNHLASRAAFEFRHASWHDDAVYQTLRDAGAALCVADSEKLTTPVIATAPFGYFRLRDEGYGPDDIGRWYNTIRGQAAWEGKDVFVYFKHEDAGKGAEFGQVLKNLVAAA